MLVDEVKCRRMIPYVRIVVVVDLYWITKEQLNLTLVPNRVLYYHISKKKLSKEVDPKYVRAKSDKKKDRKVKLSPDFENKEVR
ncbi:hypothetical protein PPRFG01_0019200 [Plasmodium sp.]|nr:hypothetical protein PPRFG01_0019200 [Plasmodium sp.]